MVIRCGNMTIFINDKRDQPDIFDRFSEFSSRRNSLSFWIGRRYSVIYFILISLSVMMKCSASPLEGLNTSNMYAKPMRNSLALKGPTFASCDDILHHSPDATSGTFAIQMDNDAIIPMYCDFEHANVRAFLDLGVPAENTGVASRNGCFHRMEFSKIALDLRNLVVDTHDMRFAVNDAGDCHDADMPVALSSVRGCESRHSSKVRAAISLRGTPFVVNTTATSLVCEHGDSSDGVLLYSDDNERAEITTTPHFCGTCYLNPLVLQVRLCQIRYRPSSALWQ